MGIRTLAIAFLVTSLSLGGMAAAGTSVVFSKDEIAIINDYYARHPVDTGSTQQKKAKNKGLPPGIAKNLARGKPLPPGIAKKQLPSDLVRMLPPVYPGYERVVLDGRVLLVDIATQMINDVLMQAAH